MNLYLQKLEDGSAAISDSGGDDNFGDALAMIAYTHKYHVVGHAVFDKRR